MHVPGCVKLVLYTYINSHVHIYTVIYEVNESHAVHITALLHVWQRKRTARWAGRVSWRPRS